MNYKSAVERMHNYYIYLPTKGPDHLIEICTTLYNTYNIILKIIAGMKTV